MVTLPTSLGLIPLESNFTHKVWFKPDNPSRLNFEKFETDFGNDDSVILVIENKKGLFNPQSIQLIQELTDEFWQLSQVIRVDSLTNYQLSRAQEDSILIDAFIPYEKGAAQITREFLHEKKKQALDNEVMVDFLINSSATVTLLYGHLKPGFENKLELKQTYQQVKALVEKFSTDTEHSFQITGNLALQGALEEMLMDDVKILSPLLLLLVGLLMFYIFRSILLAVCTLLVCLFSTLATVGLAGWLKIPLDPMTTTLPQILIAVGVADALHVISTFFFQRQKNVDTLEALRMALEKNWAPTLMTSFTTSIGFSSLYFSTVAPISHLGVLVAIGAGLAWFYTYTLIYLAVKLSPHTPFRPRKLAFARLSAQYPAALVHFLSRHRKGVIVSFTLIGVCSLFIGSQNIVENDPIQFFQPDHPVRLASDFVVKEVGGYSVLEIIVDSGRPDGSKDPNFLNHVDEFAQWLRGQPYITKVNSLIDIVKDVNQSLNADDPQFKKIPLQQSKVAESLFLYSLSLPPGQELTHWSTVDFQKMRLSVWWTVQTTNTTLATMKKIEEKAKEMQLDIALTGKSALTSNLGPMVLQTFFSSLLITLLIITIVMAVLFQSISLGLLSMLPNVFPPMLGFAFMKLVGFPLDVGTAIVMSIALGIAVDDTIHILTDYRRSRERGEDGLVALQHTFAHSGRAVITTTFLLVVGFSSFVFGSFVPTLEFGVTTAFTLAMALLTDLTLLPALLLSFKNIK